MTLRAALIGTQHPHSQAYQRTLAAVPGLAVTAICADDGGGGVAEALGAARRFATFEELHAAADYDVAFVFLPADKAFPVLRRLVEAGKHVFCEKPTCRTAGEARQVVQWVDSRQVRFCTGYQLRMHPIARDIRGIVREGLLGGLYSLESRMITTSVRVRGPNHYLFQADRSGGGILHWLGCHHIDFIRYISGQEVTSVTGLIANAGETAIDVEDLAVVGMRLSGGALASVHAGYLLPNAAPNPYMAPRYETFLGIRGELGRIQWDPFSNEFIVESTHPAWNGAGGRRMSYSLEEGPGYGRDGYNLVKAFLARVRGEAAHAPLYADALDAYKTLEVIEAAYESARTGRTINL